MSAMDFYGPPPPPPVARNDWGAVNNAAGLLAVVGAITGAIGSFYQAKDAQYRLRSDALSAEFASNIANLNARAAEADASLIVQAGQREVAMIGLRTALAKGAQRAQVAASGLSGVGSSAEAAASAVLAGRIDELTVGSNTVRAANAARARGADFRNQSLLAGVSARNLRGSAGSIRPGVSAAGTLLTSGSEAVGRWALSRERY